MPSLFEANVLLATNERETRRFDQVSAETVEGLVTLPMTIAVIVNRYLSAVREDA